MYMLVNRTQRTLPHSTRYYNRPSLLTYNRKSQNYHPICHQPPKPASDSPSHPQQSPLIGSITHFTLVPRTSTLSMLLKYALSIFLFAPVIYSGYVNTLSFTKAAETGDSKTVARILTRHHDISVKDVLWALQRAAGNLQKDIATLILENCILKSANSPIWDLFVKSWLGDTKNVTLLLQKHEKIPLDGTLTALQSATFNGHINTVALITVLSTRIP